MENLLQRIWELVTLYGLRVLAAVAILLLGRWIAKFIQGLIEKLMQKKSVDTTLVSFVGDLIYFVLLTFVVLAALNQIGIQTTSFVAIIGAAGLAVGLALQGSLANFAAGILMIIFRPFKVGDYIEGAGVAGKVVLIQVFTTQLLTPDNKTIIVPNAKLTGDNIVNYSTQGTRRIDLVFGIGYGDDIDKARNIITATLAEDARILPDPAPKVAVAELGDSSVNFIVRPWTSTDDYWDVRFELVEKIKKRFDAQGITIPYPQRDVHIYEHKTA